MDSDSNGFLNLNELGKLTEENFKINIELFAKNFFRELNTSKDGFLKFDEFRKASQFEEVPEENLRDDFYQLDLNQDGKLSLEEFINAIKEKSLFLDQTIENYF